MYRLVALGLALLMPLQFAWAAAAAFCQHESTTNASPMHIGHHEHVHKADAKKAGSGKLMADSDCGACHATCSAVASEAPAGPEAPALSGRLMLPG